MDLVYGANSPFGGHSASSVLFSFNPGIAYKQPYSRPARLQVIKQ
jgi:hypothetical protein